MRDFEDIKRQLSEGVLAFPATPFDTAGELDREALSRHVDDMIEGGPCALVPAGGAGELFSLAPAEHEAVIRTTVEASRGIPVIAGIGNGLAITIEMAIAAERAGADALLLLPPYLTTAEQDGLFAFTRKVCEAVSIGVIAYSRNNGILSPQTTLRLADSCANFIGLKDGVGDFEVLNQMALSASDRLVIINGVPTAEILAAQCFAIGIRSYSSAVFAFAPVVARRFFEAIRDGERAVSDHLMRELYLPLIALRNRRRGYAVSLVKGGLKAVGRGIGAVRPPLIDLADSEVDEIAALIERASAFVAGLPVKNAGAALLAEGAR
jgi:5-dehydro-4-deoxyglucarate dehydratase